MLSVRVPVTQAFGGDFDRDTSRFATIQMHAGETAQCEFRLRNTGIDVAIINLCHFIAVTFASVFDSERHVRNAVGNDLLRIQLAALEIELRVAQAVAECELGLAIEVAIGPVAHRVICETRQVCGGPVERHR